MKKPSQQQAATDADEVSLFPRGQADWRALERAGEAGSRESGPVVPEQPEARPARKKKRREESVAAREDSAREDSAREDSAREDAAPAAPATAELEERPVPASRTAPVPQLNPVPEPQLKRKRRALLLGAGFVFTVAATILVLRPLRPLATRSQPGAPATPETPARLAAERQASRALRASSTAPLLAPPSLPPGGPLAPATASDPRPAPPRPEGSLASRVLEALAAFEKDRDPDEEFVTDLAQVLAPFGPEGVRDAIRTLAPGDERCLTLVRALCALGPTAIPAIADLIPFCREPTVARALLRGAPAVPEALDLVTAAFTNEPDPRVRAGHLIEYSRRILGESGGADGTAGLEPVQPDAGRDRTFLRAALLDPAPVVRIAALAFVARRHDSRDADLVRDALSIEGDATVRRAAVNALARVDRKG